MQRRDWLARLVMLLLLASVGVLGVRVYKLEERLQPRVEGPAQKPLIVPRADLSPLEKTYVELFRRTSQSVVHITTLDVRTDLFRLRALEVPTGTGSGFVWDDHGNVVTNAHVVRGARAAKVTLPDQSVWQAKLVGVSQRHDLAVLRIDGAIGRSKGLPVGTSHDLVVGQLVLAIGSPFGLDYTLSTGVISGLSREIPGLLGLPIHGAIQTDAAINPGNSGGPLLDSNGRLIGVNTSILSPSGASAGIGFAVPVDTVARIVPQLIQYGREVRPVLGVEFADDEIARRLGVRGALAVRVVENGPAHKAGILGTTQEYPSGRIHLGDVITGINDKSVKSAQDVLVALDDRQPGDKVTLQIIRAGSEKLSVPLELGKNVE
jgi:S1-C subfamily serine protease